MSRTSEFLIGAVERAGWPLEGMDLAIEIGEQVGYERLEAELRDRAERACSGFTGCLVAFGEGRGVLCDPCPLTTLRDANSDECEYGAPDPLPCPWGTRGTQDCAEFHPDCDGARCGVPAGLQS